MEGISIHFQVEGAASLVQTFFQCCVHFDFVHLAIDEGFYSYYVSVPFLHRESINSLIHVQL